MLSKVDILGCIAVDTLMEAKVKLPQIEGDRR